MSVQAESSKPLAPPPVTLKPRDAFADPLPTTPDALARIRAAFTAPEPPAPGELPGVSAVLIPLYELRDGVVVLYTKRSERMSKHPGQMSFPGGRMDPVDGTPLMAALRESHEEVGIRPESVDVLGHVTDMTTYYGTFVRAYAGLVADAPPTKPTSADEVEGVYVKPLAELLSPAHYEGRAMETGEREGRVVHYFTGNHPTIWGITGEITARFLARAYGWVPPAPARVIREMSDFMP